MLRNTFVYSFLLLAAVLTGCTAKAKLERHVSRADAYFEKGDHEKARIEYLNAFQLDRKNPHVAARLGESFLKNGDVANAYRLFRHSLELQPTNVETRVKIASIQLLGGDPTNAWNEASEILKIQPLHPDALLVYANASIGSNRLAAARARLESLAAAHPTNSSVYLGLGTIAQRVGDVANAESALKKAVQLDPKSAKCNLALGSFYFLRGDTNNAEIHLKTAMDSSPAKSVERLGFAEFQIKTGRSEAAEATLNEATSKHPEFMAGWNMLTQIAFARNDTNKAANYITKALANSPQDRDALMNQARLKLATRDFKSAAADLERLATQNPRDSQAHFQLAIARIALEDSSQALVSLDKAIAANTNNVDAYLLRSRLNIARSDWNEAIAELRQLTNRFPNVSQSYFLLASAHRGHGNIDEAASVYRTITKKFPNDPQGHQLLGVVLRQQARIPQARQAFENALKVNPDYLAAIESVVDLDIAAKQFEPAIARIQHYLDKYPKSPLPPLLLGKVLFQQKRNAEAEAAVQKAIALDPEFTPAHRALASFYVSSQQTEKAIVKFESFLAKDQKDIAGLIQLGMLYEAKGEYDGAFKCYQNVLKHNPNSVVALNNIAYALSERMGKIDEALEYARRARNVSPTDPHSADTMGWILYKKGQYAEALAALQQSAERLGDQPEVQYHLGMAYYSLGGGPAATAALTKAVQSTNIFAGKDSAVAALTVLKVDPTQSSAEAVATVERHVAQNPNDAFARFQLARLYDGFGDAAKARATYEAGLAKNPKSVLLLTGLAGLSANVLNQPDRAMELARQAWTLSQTPATAASLGPIAYSAGDFKWASGRLTEALRAQASPETLLYKGLTSYALGNVAQARDELTRVTQSPGLSKEKSAMAKAALEVAKLHSGQSSAEDVEQVIKPALAVDAQFLPAKVATALLAEQKKDFVGARGAYEAALQHRPGLLVAQRQLAILLCDKLPDDAKAQQLASGLRQDLPEDAALMKVLGKVAYRRGDHREAARHLNAAAARQPNDGDLLYHLGMAQYHIKDQAAKANLTRAISIEPTAALTADAKKALSELK
jgi:tetratricopeptide (TPR) repeat protein